MAVRRACGASPSMAKRSRGFGYSGSSAIHPSQVPLLNAAFSPDPAEIAHAAGAREVDVWAVARTLPPAP